MILKSEIDWLEDTCQTIIKGCRKKAFNGTILFRPDCEGHYDALWTRDFYYMTQVFDFLNPKEVKKAILYLIEGQREDGVIPDRRQADGLSVYEAGPVGKPIALYPMDNAAFLILSVAQYVRGTGEIEFFNNLFFRLDKAMETIPHSNSGLVFNDPQSPHSPYGFTDCIGKTGELLFCSLLDWQASGELCKLLRKVNNKVYEEKYYNHREKIEKNINHLWDEAKGIFLAATKDCRQIDVWGNAFIIYLDFPLKENQRHSIFKFFVEHLDEISQKGQIRHLLYPELWQQLLIPVPAGEYQNGGYWTTASGWAMTALAKTNIELAEQLFKDLITDYRRRGIYEWINGPRVNLPNYVASVVNPLVAVRDLIQQRKFVLGKEKY